MHPMLPHHCDVCEGHLVDEDPDPNEELTNNYDDLHWHVACHGQEFSKNFRKRLMTPKEYQVHSYSTHGAGFFDQRKEDEKKAVSLLTMQDETLLQWRRIKKAAKKLKKLL